MRDVPRCAAQQFGVFTRAQASDEGWTTDALRHAIDSGHLVRPRASVYAVATERHDPDGLVIAATRRAVAAALTHREAAVSHASGARLLGLPVIGREPRACLTVPPGARRDAARAHLHRAVLPPLHLSRIGLIPATTAARTVVDCARELGTEAALVMADAALRRALLTPAELAGVIEMCRRLPYIRRATELAGMADALAESALESRSRWRIHLQGLPPPRLQQIILDAWGRFVAKVDFYWDEFGVVGEADGEGKQQSLTALRAQHDRERELRDLGLLVTRWGWADLSPFDGVAGRLDDAFSRGIPPTAARRWQLARAMPR